MTDPLPKPKPKSRRRRWIIVGILLLVSFIVLWLPPRVDSRLVGKWKATGGPAVVFFELQANGIATIELEDRSKKNTASWFVSDEKIVLGSPLPYVLSASLHKLQVAIFKTTGRVMDLTPGFYYEIEHVDVDR